MLAFVLLSVALAVLALAPLPTQRQWQIVLHVVSAVLAVSAALAAAGVIS